MISPSFNQRRRQRYLDQASYLNSVELLATDARKREQANIELPLGDAGLANNCSLIAKEQWEIFQLRYTAGEDLSFLANSLQDVVEAQTRYRRAFDASGEGRRYHAFEFEDTIDEYVNYLHLLCAAICLHREDLVPKISSLIAGGAFDGQDAVIEELLKPFISNRPEPDQWLWDTPYGGLLDAIDSESPAERAANLKKYVKNWYIKMKGKAQFWGTHELIKPEITPYFGYWAMCAAAFTYLYDIDDSSYRDEIVYPKDLADYARAHPRRTPADAARLIPNELRRCEAGQPCPASGLWFTPAKQDSRRKFAQGELMPDVQSDWGTTVWYWVREQPSASEG